MALNDGSPTKTRLNTHSSEKPRTFAAQMSFFFQVFCSRHGHGHGIATGCKHRTTTMLWHVLWHGGWAQELHMPFSPIRLKRTCSPRSSSLPFCFLQVTTELFCFHLIVAVKVATLSLLAAGSVTSSIVAGLFLSKHSAGYALYLNTKPPNHLWV